MSGIGGEVGEAEEPLSATREARDDAIQTREEKRRVAIERKAEKDRLGEIVRDRAMKRQHSSINQNSALKEDSFQPREKAPRMNRLTDDDDLSALATVLKKGDKERAKSAREKLEFAKIHFEEAKKNREFEKEERHRKREDAHKLEL